MVIVEGRDAVAHLGNVDFWSDLKKGDLWNENRNGACRKSIQKTNLEIVNTIWHSEIFGFFSDESSFWTLFSTTATFAHSKNVSAMQPCNRIWPEWFFGDKIRFDPFLTSLASRKLTSYAVKRHLKSSLMRGNYLSCKSCYRWFPMSAIRQLLSRKVRVYIVLYNCRWKVLIWSYIPNLDDSGTSLELCYDNFDVVWTYSHQRTGACISEKFRRFIKKYLFKDSRKIVLNVLLKR